MLSQKLSMTGKRDKVGMWDGDEETDLVWDGLCNITGANSPILKPKRHQSSCPSFPFILSSETLGRSWRRAFCGRLSFAGFPIHQRTLKMPLTVHTY